MKASLLIRALTVAGVAVGSALLIGALALAMRGTSPVSSDAAVTPSTQKMLAAVQRLDGSPQRLVGKLTAWHPTHIPAFHPAPPAAPRVITITAPPTVVQTAAAPAHTVTATRTAAAQPRTQAPPPVHESESGDDSHQSGGGND